MREGLLFRSYKVATIKGCFSDYSILPLCLTLFLAFRLTAGPLSQISVGVNDV